MELPIKKKTSKKKGSNSSSKTANSNSSKNHSFRLCDGNIIKYNEVDPSSAVTISRDGQLVRCQLFGPETCEKLLELTSTFTDWDALSDSVDRKSEHQHNIFDFAKGTDDGMLYPLCAHLSETVIEPVLRQHLGLSGLKLYWSFLRKYTMDGRIEFPVHRDSSAATVNILLSDPQSFTGAELYILGNEHKDADTLSDKQFKKILPESVLRHQFSIPYTQGECCMHLGKRLHGVLPLTSGSRYTLILMYMP